VTDLEQNSYDERLNNLQLYLASAGLKVTDADAVMRNFQIKHEAAMGSIMAQAAVERKNFSELTAMQQAQGMLGILTNLTAASAQKNREMFELNKLASIANAIIYTYEGANKTLSLGPWGIPLAAVIVAAGIANVATIAGTQFGSGAAASAGGGGPGVTPVNVVPTVPPAGTAVAPVQTTIVNYTGTAYERKAIKDFVQMLNENTRNGGRIVIA
jgi:hypothetical protein